MFKNFLMKQMIKRQMKNVPQAEQDRVMAIVENNPDLFVKIAHDVQEKVKGGMGQQQAMMMVMKANEVELRKIAGK